MSSEIATSFDQGYVIEIVLAKLHATFPDRVHGFFAPSDDGYVEAGVTGPELTESIRSQHLGRLTEPRVSDDVWQPSHDDGFRLQLPASMRKYHAAAVLPMRRSGNDHGVLIALDPSAGPFPSEDVRFMQSMANQAAIALENVRLYHDVETLSVTDPTTALLNRRAFDRRLREEIQRAQRYSLPLGILMVDVDFFKYYNDNHGHPAGDVILGLLGEVFDRALRESDHVFRFGGEEFTVLMPQTGPAESLELARRLCAKVRETDFPLGEKQPNGRLTISAGAAAFPEHGKTGADLVEHADLALYEAKRQGRDRAVMYDPRSMPKQAAST